jgi:hypothetical protein
MKTLNTDDMMLLGAQPEISHIEAVVQWEAKLFKGFIAFSSALRSIMYLQK